MINEKPVFKGDAGEDGSMILSKSEMEEDEDKFDEGLRVDLPGDETSSLLSEEAHNAPTL